LTDSIAHPRRREHALAAILLSGFILIFLGQPLLHYRTSVYTPADLTQLSSLTRVEEGHHIGNPILGDVILQMQSWLLFGKEELGRGRLPLWNPYNGGGTPLFANYQSAVLSPFSVPFYLLSFKNAVIVSAFLKLFVLGFFTYLFLCEIELAFPAAMTGAVAFMFAGYNVLLLGYPHPAAMVVLPSALFFAERACRRFERAAFASGGTSPGAGAASARSGIAHLARDADAQSGARSGVQPGVQSDARSGVAHFARDADAQSGARSGVQPGVQSDARSGVAHFARDADAQSGARSDAPSGARSGALPEARPMRAVGAWPFVGFGVALVTGLLTGQPEPLYFSVLLLGAYMAARIARMWMRTRRDFAAFCRIGSLAGAFLLVGAFAIGIAAVQLVPFFEYLRQSRLLEQRSDVQTPLSLVIWPLLFFPNLLGNPSTYYYIKQSVPPPDFETANLVYSGGIVMLLALISLLFINRNRRHMFFAMAALVWFLYAYDVGGAWHLFALLPSVEIAPINRSQGIWEFCLACCAAFAVHYFVHARVPVRSMLFASTLFAGVVMITTFAFGAQHLAVYAFAYLKTVPGREAIYEYSKPHVLHVSLAFLPGVLALSVMLLAPQGRIRRVLTAVIVLSVFLQTGYLFKNYNPVSAERFVFPKTKAVNDLTETVGRDSLAVLGDDSVIPDSNIVYHLSMPASYDGLWIGRYDKLYREIFGEGDNWRPMRKGTLQGLELFGVDYVLGSSDWLDLDTPFVEIPDNPRAFYETAEILPGADVVQTFTCARDRLQAIRLSAGSLGHPGACTLHVALEDPKDGRTMAAHDFDCRALTSDPASKTSLVFAFDPIADSNGRTFRLRASSPDAQAGAGISLWCRSDWRHWTNVALWRATEEKSLGKWTPPSADHAQLAAWSLAQGKKALEGGLWFNFTTTRDAFQSVRPIGARTLYKIADGPARFRWVGRAISADSDAQEYARAQSPEFDPKLAVVLGASDLDGVGAPTEVSEPSVVRILEEEPTRIRLELEHPHPGWIVFAKPWYPGWIARVDGEERPLLRANYAFCAVRVATGESRVELEYDPSSFRRGAWISGFSALGMALFLSLLALRARATPSES
jgi:Bacterial membrane protein YfhO